jgi:hypothetical protein
MLPRPVAGLPRAQFSQPPLLLIGQGGLLIHSLPLPPRPRPTDAGLLAASTIVHSPPNLLSAVTRCSNFGVGRMMEQGRNSWGWKDDGAGKKFLELSFSSSINIINFILIITSSGRLAIDFLEKTPALSIHIKIGLIQFSFYRFLVWHCVKEGETENLVYGFRTGIFLIEWTAVTDVGSIRRKI